MDFFIRGGATGTNSMIFKNNSGLYFTIQQNFATRPTPINSAAFGDYNNDGLYDLAIASYSSSASNSAFIVFKNVNGTFTPVWQSSNFAYSYAVAWADIDNDGLLDLLTCDYPSAGSTLRIYRNLGTDNFELFESFPNIGRSAGFVCADFYNDNKVAVLQPTYTGGPLVIYRNAIPNLHTAPNPPASGFEQL
ncbi:MAG: VCBS repeat-containing protein [Elusimicrobiota bacterium]|nr:VCBS repeat-containing protein [Elusimicrobiota bacterium]